MAQNHKVCTLCGYVGKAGFIFSKLGSVKCPQCEQQTMVPLRSLEGQAVLLQSGNQPRVWDDSEKLVSNK